MKDYKSERSVSTVAALLLLAVFAVGILGVLLGGAQSYRYLTQRDAAAYDSRTCTQYLVTKLRQAPQCNGVQVVPFGDGSALLIPETVDGEDYVTRIYCHAGWLMELYSVADGEFSPEDGEKILPASDLTITRQQDLLLIGITDANDQVLQMKISLRGWEELP
ncbi:MAG: DUF4860 domain-containing protein [Oscillospiraceae bacterium]|nr:DUF4860 domain-containing protein [Oscillospiraceae bacterium]